MKASERAIHALGHLAARLEDSSDCGGWVIRRRFAACADLAAADRDWPGSTEDLLRLVLRYQAASVEAPEKIVRGAQAAAGYAILQAEMALSSARVARRDLVARDLYGPGFSDWLTTCRALRARIQAAPAGLEDLAATTWLVGQEDVRRSCLMVAVATVVRDRYRLGADAPGIWGALPRPAEGRTRFAGRFAVALAAQASAAEAELDEILAIRQASEPLLTGLRATSRLPQALDLIVERRVISPALLQRVLGCSLRGASKILDEMVRRGLALEIENRSAYRRFVHPADTVAVAVLLGAEVAERCADEIARKAAEASEPPAPARVHNPSPADVPHGLPDGLDLDAADALEAALGASDAANARIAEVLARYGKRAEIGNLEGEAREDDAEADEDPPGLW